MKEQKDNEHKNKPKANKEKRFYLFTALGCAAALVAIIVVAVVVNSMGNGGQNQVTNPPVNSSNSADSGDTDGSGSSDTGVGDLDSNKPVGGDNEGMILPVAEATLMNDHGFYYNQTLNIYYEHAGVDFAAEEGAQVFAVDDGVVESIYKDDLLLGTEIVVVHADGVKSVYRFVTEVEGLQVGAEVARGECIATVAAATGNEYKEGPHLHFEILKDGQSIDPTVYLTLEEK